MGSPQVTAGRRGRGVVSIRPDDPQPGEGGEVFDILREDFDAQAQGGGGDLAIGPVDAVREAKLAVEVECDQAVDFVRYSQVEAFQESIRLSSFLSRAPA